MASSRVYFDSRNRKEGGLLSIIIRHKGGMFTVPLNIRLSDEQWDAEKQEVNRKNPQYRRYNNHVRSILAKVENILLDLSEEGKLGGLTTKQLKRIVTDRLKISSDARSMTIYEFGLSYMEKINNSRTKETYALTLKKLEDYTGGKDLFFEDISLDWLENFDAWMDKSGMSVNGKSFYLRTIRALFNRAIDKDVIEQNIYPFRKFCIKRESTPKRSLTVEELRLLRDYPCEEWQEKWRDMFMLVFYLIGINTVDLMALTEVRNGRIEYRRAKTHRLYSIKVEPEAQAIIDKHKGADHLLDFADRYADHGDFRRRMNAALKKIGPMEWVENRSKINPKKNKKQYHSLFPNITSYWARHTWATIAASLDIPKETIAAALGHGGDTVTDIYIDFDQRKVDEANRKVIDFLNKQVGER